MKLTLLYISVFALALFGCKQSDIDKVKLEQLNGDEIELKDYEGKIVFINVWATWCGPCIKEMPSIDEAQNKLENKDVVFLIASNEEPEEIKEFVEKWSLDLQFVRLRNLEELEIAALPTTYIYDRSGKLKFFETGARDWSQPDNLNLIVQ